LLWHWLDLESFQGSDQSCGEKSAGVRVVEKTPHKKRKIQELASTVIPSAWKDTGDEIGRRKQTVAVLLTLSLLRCRPREGKGVQLAGLGSTSDPYLAFRRPPSTCIRVDASRCLAHIQHLLPGFAASLVLPLCMA